MINQPDPLYVLREDDPAQFEAIDGDLLDIRLIADEDESLPETVELEAVLA